jgi:hypothetical protein
LPPFSLLLFLPRLPDTHILFTGAGRSNSQVSIQLTAFKPMLSATGMSPVPRICISPASPEEASPGPCSSFSSMKPGHDDGRYRQRDFSPQCHFPDMSPRHSSPLRPADCPPPRGLHRDQLDLLLKASSERRAAFGSRKVPDLRKELVIKNQKNKHRESNESV